MEQDLIVTWPKARAFGSYMVELERAKTRGLVINYRVAQSPGRETADGARLYRVYDGRVRGWTPLISVSWQPGGRVLDPATGSFMAAGYYLVCRPDWNEAPRKIEMRGFRGWRWFDRSLTVP